jgi:DNA-binding transcriptional LysR family regulator
MTIMDKLSSLRAFVKVVELGSFSEAGRQLRLSRSAISSRNSASSF